MNCALWLNKRKIRHASEIAENIDIAALRGYYLAGSLETWLRENGGEEQADKLAAIKPDDCRLNERLAEIFGGKNISKRIVLGAGVEDENRRGDTYSPIKLPDSLSGASFAYRRVSSFGSFGSLAWGSFSGWNWLFELFEKGSFGFGSFGSFHEWEWEWLYRLFGGGGSFSFSSFGSFGFEFLNGLFGSFAPFADLSRFPELDEYDRIMLETLMRCPLDRFGYGIHNI